jgi:MYXO-CTERM domain-containing protein
MSLSLCLTILVPLALALDEDCTFGVNAHQASDADLATMADAEIAWVRLDFNWFQFEPAKGSYDWSIPDRFIDGAATQGQHVFASIGYTPEWAVGQACNNADPNELNWCLNKPPANRADWVGFVTAAVDRYGDRVKHWGIWNEPNLVQFYDGDREGWVTNILEPGADAVHDTCADCFVLGPELANLRSGNWDGEEGFCIGGECIFNGWNHSLIEILKAAGGHLDIITHHKYSDSSTELLAELADGEWLIIQYMYGLKEITDAHAPGKPVWLTEFGWETTPGGERSQGQAASELEDAFVGAAALRAGTYAGAVNQPWPELEKLFWYDLIDDPNVYDWGYYTWGLLDADGVPKDAMGSYRDVVAASGGCADITPPDPKDTGEPATEPHDTGGADTEPQDSDPVDCEPDTETESQDDTGTGAGLPNDPVTSDEWNPGCGCHHAPAGKLAWLGGLLVGGVLLRRRRQLPL